MDKTVLSFYLDDTSPYRLPGNPFKTFLDFVSGEGIAGEASLILGHKFESHGLLSEPQTDEQRIFIEQTRRAFSCGIDTHMELMTHSGLFDFENRTIPEDAIHEGLWLHEPEVSTEQYEAYFRSIIAEGEKVGIEFTGVTWPGCDCERCRKRYREITGGGRPNPNSGVWEALLRLAKENKFRGRTVPCFTLDPYDEIAAISRAGDSEYGVYDLPTNADDRFGIWTNDPDCVDPDYYITADGERGHFIRLIQRKSPYCLFYCHWQSINPATGVGWKAFTEVIQRVNKHLREDIIWMRPSAYTDLVHTGPSLAQKNEGPA